MFICRFLIIFFIVVIFLAFPLGHFATGVLDMAFGKGGVVVTDLGSDASVKSLHQQADGKIVVVARTNGSIILLRYNADGGLDTTFGTNGRIITAYSSSDTKVTVTLQSNGLYAVGNNSSVIRYTSAGGIREIVNFPMGESAGFGLDGKIATASLVPANGGCFTQQNKISYSLYDPTGTLLSSTQFCSGGGGFYGVVSIWGIAPGSANSFYIGYNHRSLNVSSGRVREMLNSTTLQDTSVELGLIGYNLVDLTGTENNGFVALGFWQSMRQLPGVQTYMLAPLPPASATYKKIHGNDITAALKGNSFVLVLNEAFSFHGSEYIGRYFGAAPEQSSVYVQSDNKILIGGQIRSEDGSHWNIGLIRYSSVRGGSVEMADFDDDARSDLSVWRPSDNRWYLLRSIAGYTAMQLGSAGDRIAPADYDGDAKTDLAVFRPSEGKWYILMSSFPRIATFNWGMPGDIPVPSDRDADGKTDLVVYRESDNTWYTRSIATEEISVVRFGQDGDRLIVGDFDADGKGDTAVFRPSNNSWYMLNGVGYSVRTWGETGDNPVPSDYDGDGATDIAIFRPTTGQWWRIRSSSGGTAFDVVTWGETGDIPVPADYDGDGQSDTAVFRPSNGTWYIIAPTDGFIIRPFGQSGDVPTQSAFIY